MKTNQVNFKAGKLIELSFATIQQGQEAKVFNDYFPKVMPIVMSLGAQPLGSFSIHETNSTLGSPKMGALFQWPSIEVFNQLHENTEFLALKSIRDDVMEYFSNGHFFEVQQDCTVTFTEAQRYLLVTDQKMDNALLNLTPVNSVASMPFQPNLLQIVDKNNASSLKAETTQYFEFSMNIK